MLRRPRRCRRCDSLMPLPAARRVAAEELGLGDHRLLELVEQHALVRRVDVGEPVGRAEQQHLGLGRRLLQRADERDRAAGRDATRSRCPRPPRARRAPPRRPGPRSPRRSPCRSRAACTVERDRRTAAAPRGAASSAACASTGSCSGMHAQAQLGPRVRHDRVDRLVDRQHVDAGDGDRRAGPDPLAETAGAEERQPGLDLRQLAELLVAVRGARPLLAPQARRPRRRRARRAAPRARAAARSARRAPRRRTGRCASARRASRTST